MRTVCPLVHPTCCPHKPAKPIKLFPNFEDVKCGNPAIESRLSRRRKPRLKQRSGRWGFPTCFASINAFEVSPRRNPLDLPPNIVMHQFVYRHVLGNALQTHDSSDEFRPLWRDLATDVLVWLKFDTAVLVFGHAALGKNSTNWKSPPNFTNRDDKHVLHRQVPVFVLLAGRAFLASLLPEPGWPSGTFPCSAGSLSHALDHVQYGQCSPKQPL